MMMSMTHMQLDALCAPSNYSSKLAALSYRPAIAVVRWGPESQHFKAAMQSCLPALHPLLVLCLVDQNACQIVKAA